MFYSINFLRFIASVGVVIHHALGFTGTQISVGAAGVDVFFIISGIVIGFSTGEKTTPYAFFAKRFIRVLPLYWLATFAYLGFKFLEWNDLPQWETFWRSMLLWPDFGTGWHPIYYPGWTLGYELFFYLIFGSIFIFFRKNAAALCALVMCCVSLVLIPVPGKTGVYFDSRLCFEFVFGLIFAHLFLKRRMVIDPKLGTASALAALVIFSLNYTSNGIDRVLAWGVPSLLLVIGLFAHERSPFFRRRFAVVLGDASYSVYLVHITVIEFILETLKRNDVSAEAIKAQWPLTLLVLVGASVAVGVMVHRFVEQPLLEYLRRVLLGGERLKTPVADVEAVLPVAEAPEDVLPEAAPSPVVPAVAAPKPEPVAAPPRVRKPVVVDERRLPLRLDWKPLTLPVLLVGVFLAWVVSRAFDWPQADDFLLVDWFRRLFITGELGIGDVLTLKNGPHPVGFQALVTVLLFKVFGVSFNLLVGLNLLIAATCGLLLSALVLSDSNSRLVRWVAPVLLMVVFLHPIQMNHLVWPFELGWFMVSLALVANVALVEFRGVRAVPWVAVVCLLGTMSTGQGGFLWVLAGLHFLLFGGPGRYGRAGGFLMAFVVVSAYLTSSTGEVSGLMNDGVGGLILYFAQLFGGVFGVRGTRSTWVLGALVLAVALGLAVAAIVRRQAARPIERAGVVLVAGALLMAVGFTLARYKFGIVWALDRFHAAPLLVPVLAGIVLLASRYFETGASVAARGLALVAQAGVVASVVMAVPYATGRFDEQITARGFGMAVACDQQDDPYLETSASGLADWSFFLLTKNRDVLAQLCSDRLPVDARALLKLPDDFAGWISREPATADGLTALWRIYQTHGDLQRAFPPSQPEVGKNLLMFARNNALTGSQYEKDILGPHADLYVRLHDAK